MGIKILIVASLFMTYCNYIPRQIFGEHPLMSLETYCNASYHQRISTLLLNNQSEIGSPISLATQNGQGLDVFDEEILENARINDKAEPNTALLSAILMFGTFFIAYFLRIFRNGKYLGRTVSGMLINCFARDASLEVFFV